MDRIPLQASDHSDPWQNASYDIGRVLTEHGFSRQQSSVCFGDDTVDAVRFVLATQALTRRCPWFPAAVRDMHMLRIEDNNDLMLAENAV